MPAPLLQVIYRSQATHPIGHHSDLRILRASLRNNDPNLVTGFLLRSPDQFFQVLEGPRKAIHPLMARIKADADHQSLEVILSQGIHLRRFGEWTMGYAEVSRQNLELLNLQCDAGEDPERLLKEFELLAVFHQINLLARARESMIDAH